LNISVHQAEKLSLEEIGRFVEASEGLRFEGEGREQVYGWIERVLCQQEYAGQGKGARGLLRRYIEKMTGMSRAQVMRLLARYTATGRVAATSHQRHRFCSRYTRADVELLAEVDGPPPRQSASHDRPRQEWIEIPVPPHRVAALVA
jgi:hypothetical protein